MNQPITPVRIPKAATVYSPTTQDPDLRSQINAVLLSGGHIEKIQATLQQAMHADSSNWPSRLRAHTLSLLRSGDPTLTTFPALMSRILEDIKRDTDMEALMPLSSANNMLSQSASVLSSSPEEVRKKNGAGVVGNGLAAGSATSLAIPKNVVEEGIKVTKECLESVCEFEG